MNIEIDFSWTHIALPVIGAGVGAGVVLLATFLSEKLRSIWGGIVG